MTSAPVPSAPLVLRETLDATAILKLNRPEARNSLSAAMIVALGEAFYAIARDRAIRAVALSRNVARKHAMEMLLTGDLISAEEALRIGLVNRVVAPGREREEALILARKIAAKSTHVVKIGKEAFYRQLELDLAGAYAYASNVMVENMLARDAEEGIAAFVEKRPPKWEDR